MRSIALCTLILAVAGLCAPGPLRAEGCSPSAKITDAVKKFSVVVPKAAGLGEQSFDDIGCAVASRNEECATRQGMFDGGALTYDYATGEELAVDKAYFVIKTDVATPKGYGVVAFKDRPAAEKFSHEHGKGKVVKWFELVDEKLK